MRQNRVWFCIRQVATNVSQARSYRQPLADRGCACVCGVPLGQFLIRARKKFDQMDTDGSGELSGTELQKVVDWVRAEC